jgi:DNA-binding beta-propeller fold protein YncE
MTDPRTEGVESLSATRDRQRRATRTFLVLLALLLLLLLCAALGVLLSVRRAPERNPVLTRLPGVRYEFAAFGGSFGRLDHPTGVAYDGQNTIYVTESVQGKILVFDRDGKNGRLFSTRDQAVRNPTGIDVGTDGLIYVADPPNSVVFVFDSQGNKVREIKVSAATWVHVDRDRVYVLNDATLFVTDLQGNPLGQWGSFGREVDQLATPGGVTADAARRVYIGDLGNYRVVALGPDLSRLWQVGAVALTDEAANSRPFGGPAGITVGGDGNIYFLDGVSSKIFVVDKSGKLISQPLSGPGNADDQLYLPRSIDWMDRDLFVIADTFHNRIVGLRLTPQPIGK